MVSVKFTSKVDTAKMKLLFVVLALVYGLSEALPWPQLPGKPSEPSTLRQVHTVFRHGNRNPTEGSIWDGNSYNNASFYPEGYGQLTNKGKLTEYNLGKLLRERYDSLLGDIWNIDIQEFTSTDVNRTKMSGLLVMAGLWPPKGSNVWSDELPWQPIPYNYEASSAELTGMSCDTFGAAFAEAYASENIQTYLSERYSDLLEILAKNANVSSYISGISIYDVLKVQEDLGFELDEWAQEVYPLPLRDLAVDVYYLFTNTTTLKQISAGTFIRKVLNDTQDFINGTVTKKLFAYSAHDTNVGSTLLTLGGYTMTNTPPYGSAVIFEVHEIDEIWGFKLFYNDYTEGSPHPVIIPGCDTFCSIDDFATLLEDVLPTTDVCNA